jgi:hypothetical protein
MDWLADKRLDKTAYIACTLYTHEIMVAEPGETNVREQEAMR